jgi:hypothetical protein
MVTHKMDTWSLPMRMDVAAMSVDRQEIRPCSSSGTLWYIRPSEPVDPSDAEASF